MEESTQTPGKFLKIIRFPLLRIIIGSIWVIIFMAVQAVIFHFIPGEKAIWHKLLSAVFTAIFATAGYITFVRVIERRQVSEFDFSGSLQETMLGIGLGIGLISFVTLVLWTMGAYSITGMNSWTVLLPMVALGITSGFMEEIIFRGVIFRIMEEGLGTWISLLISALIFGLVHLSNPNATVTAGLAIALEAGILLGAAYLLTRRLWFAIGIHMAWNFTEGGIFGGPVSGIDSKGLFQAVFSGSDTITGGKFGIEASVIAIIVCTAAGIIILWKAKEKGHFIQPFWTRKKISNTTEITENQEM